MAFKKLYDALFNSYKVEAEEQGDGSWRQVISIGSGSTAGTEFDDGDTIDTDSQGTLLIGTTDVPGTARAVITDDDGHLQVDVLSGGGAGTEYTEGDTDATITGTAVLAEGPTDTLQALQVDASKHLQVDIAADSAGLATASNQSTANASLSTIEGDTTSIDGKITACDTGAVVVSSSALPSGAATAANQTTANASLATIAGDTTSIDSKITACNTGAVVISSGTITTLSSQSQMNGFGSIGGGNKDVTTAGVAEALGSSTSIKRVDIIAKEGNSGTIWVGGSSVSAGNGRPLKPLQLYTVYMTNLNTVYVDTDNSGDGVTYVFYV